MSQSLPSEADLFHAADSTWPPFATVDRGIWTLREGRGAGNRVSAASCNVDPTAADIEIAASAMVLMNQTPLFTVRGNQPVLDGLLSEMGYRVMDPVVVLIAPCKEVAAYEQASLEVIFTDEPMPILAEIWRGGGILEPRLDVMRRVDGPKSFLFGRRNDRAAAAGFVACLKPVAVVHALEVMPIFRRQSVAEKVVRGAAWWALDHGADFIACLVTSENAPAVNLYRKMGMEVVARYHYRIKASN